MCSKFKELCEGARNVIYERLVFNQRNQKEGERIDNFVSELKRLSVTCEFGALTDSFIRDRIVGGVLSDALRGKLLKKADLLFKQLMIIAELLRPQNYKNSSLARMQIVVQNIQ